MNVYDFDKTIFYPDSTEAFIFWLSKKYPRIILKNASGIISGSIRYFTSKEDITPFKEQLYSFLPYIWDIDAEVNEFWAVYSDHLLPWYSMQHKEDDVIISAGPEFLHEPIAKKLGFTLIGTKMNRFTGRITGKNCSGEEKLHRFREAFPTQTIDNFYSDSANDTPLAREAKHAFIVRNGKLLPWPDK